MVWITQKRRSNFIRKNFYMFELAFVLDDLLGKMRLAKKIRKTFHYSPWTQNMDMMRSWRKSWNKWIA